MKVWKDVLKALGRVVAGLAPVALVCVVPAVLVLLDVAVFGMGCDELGLVEVSQALALLAIVAMMSVSARRRPGMRGGFVLAAGLFLCMFFREQDQVFEIFLPHGFWIYPVIATAAFACLYACRRPESVRDFLVAVRESRHFSVLALGFLAVVGFSRVIGMKPIWQAVVGMDDFRIAKRVAEEGVELFGYAVLVYWAVLFTADSSLRREAAR